MGSATSIQEGSGHQPLLDDDYVDDYEGHDDNGYEEHDDDDYEEHDDDGYVDDDKEENVAIMVTIMGNMVAMRKMIMETRVAMMTLKVKNKIFNVTESIVGSRCVLPRGRGWGGVWGRHLWEALSITKLDRSAQLGRKPMPGSWKGCVN